MVMVTSFHGNTMAVGLKCAVNTVDVVTEFQLVVIRILLILCTLFIYWGQ